MAWTGKQGKGAARIRKEIKRVEAENRNAKTPPERRKANRTK